MFKFDWKKKTQNELDGASVEKNVRSQFTLCSWLEEDRKPYPEAETRLTYKLVNVQGVFFDSDTIRTYHVDGIQTGRYE